MGPDRLPPLPEGSLSPAQKQAAAELATGPRGAVFGPFVPLLRSPDFLSPLQKTGEYLRFRSALPPRARTAISATTNAAPKTIIDSAAPRPNCRFCSSVTNV